MKNFYKIIAAVFFIVIIPNANATEENNGYLDPVQTNLGFTATLNEQGYVETNWDKFDGDLKFYKLVRSQENTDPYYPEDGYIYYSEDKDATSFADKDVPIGTNHYRICVITNQNERLCSPVVIVDKKDGDFCVEMIQAAKDPESGECKEFSTPCDVPNDWTKVNSCTDVSSSKISLSIERNDTEITLNWELEGSAPEGFKIAKSTKNLEPTYPVKEGDSYEYLTDPNARSFIDKNTVAGKTYYYRVCIYISGQCEPYSNSVSMRIPENTAITSNDNDSDNTKKTFSDVKSDDWFENFVEDFVSRDIIEGYSDGTFRPASNINRAEMAKIIANFNGKIIQTWDSQVFCDVPTTAWFHPYVMDLYYKNIASGFVGGNCSTNREFRASKALTRAEAIKIIMSLFEIETPTLDSGQNTGFSDVKASDWVAPYVKKAFELGVVQGFEDGAFRPDANVNRAEFVKMLAEAEEKLGS